MVNADPIVEELMSPGEEFEVISEGSIRIFKNSPKNMSSLLLRLFFPMIVKNVQSILKHLPKRES